MTFVSELEPQPVWRHFDRILEIPRGSKEEDAIRAYVLEVAERTGLEHRVDGAGNVVVRKPAAEGREDAPITVLQRSNAVRLLARILDAAAGGATFQLAELRGGDKHNAIPREARATVTLAADDVEDFRKRAQDEFSGIREAFAAADPDMELVVEEGEVPEAVLDVSSSWNALHLVHALPHGVASMSYDIPELVETSTNLAAVELGFDRLEILTSTRSSVATELEALRARIRAIAHLAGADVEEGTPYPGWKPDLESHVLEVLSAVFEEQRGKKPHVEAVHAGLETGIIGEKVPGMDMVSFGPQIEFPHSPDEKVHIDSVGRFYRLLVGTLERLA